MQPLNQLDASVLDCILDILPDDGKCATLVVFQILAPLDIPSTCVSVYINHQRDLAIQLMQIVGDLIGSAVFESFSRELVVLFLY